MGEVIATIGPGPDTDPNHILKDDDILWVCNCGGDLFFLTPDGAVCQQCGIVRIQCSE